MCKFCWNLFSRSSDTPIFTCLNTPFRIWQFYNNHIHLSIHISYMYVYIHLVKSFTATQKDIASIVFPSYIEYRYTDVIQVYCVCSSLSNLRPSIKGQLQRTPYYCYLLFLYKRYPLISKYESNSFSLSHTDKINDRGPKHYINI